jgi:hypothetical protein
MAGAVVDEPGDVGIGLLKGLGNLPSDIANLYVMAGKQSLPGQLMENMARAMDAQALAAFDAADVAKANALAKFAANIRNVGYVDDIFELKGDAQKRGSVLSMFVPVGGMVKAVRVVKVAKTTKVTKTATKAARKGQGVKIKLPLRQDYNKEVEALKNVARDMRTEGATPEQIARKLHQLRRELGIKYKNLTPIDKLKEIHARNLLKYGDKLGPSIDWLRSQGKSWEQIIESASRTGGKDLGF